MNWPLPVWHFLVHWTGGDYGTTYGRFEPYDFLSGVAGLSLIGILINQVRRYNCHAKRCWRIGRQHVEGTTFVTCRKHHPEGKPTAAHIRERYHLYMGRVPGRG